MKKVGRKTDMTPELIKEIKQCILDGNDIKTTATIIFNNSSNVSKEEKERGVENYIQKFYNWHYENYLNISDKIEGWTRDRKLILAEKNIEDFLKMKTMNTGTTKKGDAFDYNDSSLVRIKADISKFVSETLGKKTYSKQLNTDITSKGEKILGINYIKPDGDNNSANPKATPSIPGSSE